MMNQETVEATTPNLFRTMEAVVYTGGVTEEDDRQTIIGKAGRVVLSQGHPGPAFRELVALAEAGANVATRVLAQTDTTTREGKALAVTCWCLNVWLWGGMNAENN